MDVKKAAGKRIEEKKMDVNTAVGIRIRAARLQVEITQEKLAELSGLSVTSISRLENGKQMVSVEKLIEIAQVLNVGIESVLMDYVKRSPELHDEKDQEILFLVDHCDGKQKEYVIEHLRIFLKYLKEFQGLQ